MRCQHCGANFVSNEKLQEHQITSCPAILSDDDSMLLEADGAKDEEKVQVVYKWLEDRSIPDNIDEIHLIIDNLDVNIPLNKGTGSFRSDWMEINVGTYCGQLVIGGEILPVAEFNIEPQTETVFVIIDKEEDTNIETSTTNTGIQNTIDDPSMHELHLTAGITSAIGEPLSEEHFADSRHQENENDDIVDNPLSPEVPTLQNIDNITIDMSQNRNQPSPTEHQQPFENDLNEGGGGSGQEEDTNRAFIQMSGNSTPRSSEDNITPRENRQPSNINQMLYELSLTSPEVGQNDSPPRNGSSARSLPQVRRQRSYDSSFHGDESFSLPMDPVSPRIGNHDIIDRKRRSSDGHVNIRSPRIQGKIEPLPNQQKPYAEEENKNMRKELKRLKDLTQNYKEVKAELEVKCQSYDEEVERLKVKNQDLEQRLHAVREKTEELNGMRTELEVKCKSLEDENRRIQNQYENTIHEMKEWREKEVGIVDFPKSNGKENHIQEQTIRDLQIKLESSQDEIERLKSQCIETEDIRNQMNLMYQGEGRIANIKKVEELEKRCEAYERESERLQKQCKELENISRENAVQATNNESELESNAIRLQTQCRSYEEDLTKKEIKLQQLRDLLTQTSEQHEKREEDWAEEKMALQTRVQACNEELEKLSARCQEVEAQDATTFVDEDQSNLIEELTTKCEAYENQIGELQEMNNKCKDKYSNLKETAKQIHNQWKMFELENKNLKEENQSLETVRKLKEKDYEIEKTALESLLKKSREENTTLKLKIRKSADVETRERVENEKLRKLLQTYKHIDHDEPSEDDERILFHQPKIKSPQSQNLSKYVTGQKMTLPDRPIDTGASRYDYKEVNGGINYDRSVCIGKRTKSAESFIRKSHDVRNSRYSVNGNHGYTSSSPSHIEDVMKRYRNIDLSFDDSSYDIHVPKENYRRTKSSKYAEDENKTRYHPKAKSYDYGINHLGRKDFSSTDDSSILSPRQNHSPSFRQPFCPTYLNQINIGMKVSITRANGRLSRGTVRWLGLLPRHTGDYIGVELESESGKHDGKYDGVRYFRCKEDRGVFVKFSKIVMAWK